MIDSIKEYDEFEENIKKKFDNINDKTIYFSLLIEESSMKELKNFINNLRKNKNPNQKLNSFPKIINNFEDAINHLKNNKKINIINIRVINLIYPNFDLSINKRVTLLGGNGKLIIYFDDKNDTNNMNYINAFLLFKKNALINNKVELNKDNLYIIHKKSKIRYQFYVDIIKNQFDSNKINKNYDYIFPFKDFNNQISQIDGKKNIPKYEKTKKITGSYKGNSQSIYKTVIPKNYQKNGKGQNPNFSLEKEISYFKSTKVIGKNPADKIKKKFNNKEDLKRNDLLRKKEKLNDLIKQNELEIQKLTNKNLKYQEQINIINEQLKENGLYQRISSSNLSRFSSVISNSTKKYNSISEYSSDKQIRNNLVTKFTTSSEKSNKIKNDNSNEYNQDSGCKIFPKNPNNKYTELKILDVIKRNRIKSKKIPQGLSIEAFQNPTLIILNYVKIKLPSYIRPILYCLSQIDDLTNYFFKDDFSQNIENNEDAKLSLEYYFLNYGLWPKNNEKEFWPNDFMKELFEMSKEYGLPNESNDPSDIQYFIVFILEQLHRELKPKNKNNNQKEVQYNQFDKSDIIKCIDEFKEEDSIISKLFFGFKETTEKCLNCNDKYLDPKILCYNYEMFNCLVFPLDKIASEMNSNNVTINDCFNYIQQTELFTGDKRNYCNNCEQIYDSNFTTKIYELPEVLTLVFVRNKENEKNVKLDFKEEIDICDLKSERDASNRKNYYLCGVISYKRIKESINIDYIASCRSPVDKNWYRYSDKEVTPIKDVQNDIFDYETPYVLFYKKDKN